MTDQYKIKRLMTHRSVVICPGCGMEIRKTDDMSNVEYVRTKRKTDVFFSYRMHGKSLEQGKEIMLIGGGLKKVSRQKQKIRTMGGKSWDGQTKN